MKKVFGICSLFLLLLTACEGPQGPPGIEGIPGRDGTNSGIEPVVVEFTVDFNPDRNFTAIIDLPDGVEPSDTVLVYRNFLIDDNGNDVEVWEPLPSIVYTDEGSFQYLYNYNLRTIELSLNGNYDLNRVDINDRVNQFFKFVLIPTEVLTGVDINNIDEVLSIIK